MNPEEQRAENGEENNLEGKRDSSGESGVEVTKAEEVSRAACH